MRAHLREDVPAADVRAVCERILDAGGGLDARHVPGDDLFATVGRRVGLPLGSLTSQLWANRYLDPVDHLVKERLRLRGYLRYMDDMLLFHDDRATLEALARAVEGACWGLRLRLHPWCVQPTRGGVGFLGFRVMHDHVRVRRSSVNRALRRLRRQRAAGLDLGDEGFRDGLRATFAHWAHGDTWRLRTQTLRAIDLLADDELG